MGKAHGQPKETAKAGSFMALNLVAQMEYEYQSRTGKKTGAMEDLEATSTTKTRADRSLEIIQEELVEEAKPQKCTEIIQETRDLTVKTEPMEPMENSE